MFKRFVVAAALVCAAPALAETPNDKMTAETGTAKSQYPHSTIQACRVTVDGAADELKCDMTDPRIRVVVNCGASEFDIGPSDVAAGSDFKLRPGDGVTLTPAFTGVLGTSLSVYGRGTGDEACVLELK